MQNSTLSHFVQVTRFSWTTAGRIARAARLGLTFAAVNLLTGGTTTLGGTPLGSAFTYQGVLSSGGAGMNGTADLKFTLYDAASGGSTMGTGNNVNDLPVTNGLFTVTLDFGADAFNGEARWLEIGVRPGESTGAYTQLTPRQALTAAPAALYSRVVNAAPPGMALIPAGPFTMGDTLDGINNATPVTATVSAFYMDVNEVTLAQWKSVYLWAKTHGYNFEEAGGGESPKHPVHSANWFNSVKWCNARSQQAGKPPVYYTDAAFTQVYTTGAVNPYADWSAGGYRLPTEAEWEKAARGGLSMQRFPWGNVISHDLANYIGNTVTSYDLGPNGYLPAFTNNIYNHSSPVGYFAANGYGLYDMIGNMQEWCWDWYGTPYAGGTNPHGPLSGTTRVIRGGSWANPVKTYGRVADRVDTEPWYSDNWIGLRCVMNAGPL